jgi:hypothetical protein
MITTMTTYEVADYLGYTNPHGVSTWARRYGVVPLHRQPGRTGVNVYSQSEVVEAKQRMLGRGAGGGRKKKTT